MGRPRKIIEPGELTDRQQEVLALLAKGRTNAEIGEALGISLDGAKWHVSEIISRLGVESREQAADYWRERQRLPQRVGRRLTAPAWLTGVKLAAAVASGIAAIGIVAAVLLLARGGDDDTPVTPDETPAASSPTSATASDTPAASPTAGDGRIATYKGLPVYEITVAPPVALPAGTVLYHSQACGMCLGGELIRARTNGNGDWVMDKVNVYDPQGRDGYPIGQYFSDGRGTVAVAWCIRAGQLACPVRDVRPNDPTSQAFLLSANGGRTWQSLCDVGPACRLAGVYSQQAIIQSDDGTARLLPSGASYTLPVNTYASRTAMDSNGKVVTIGFAEVGEIPGIANDTSTLIQYAAPGSQPTDYLVFPGGNVGVAFARDGQVFAQGYRNSKGAPSGVGFSRSIAILDIAHRTLSPVTGLEGAVTDFYSPVSILYGPTFRVRTGSDCLNVREQPSTDGRSLDCLPDGEFVRSTGKSQASGGIEWVSVEMLDGRAGWVAREFVE